DCFLRIFLYDPYTHVVSTLCLHDALPISGAQVEDAFDLPLRLGELQALDDVLEAALGGGDGLLQLADLEIVLDEPHLGEDGGELGILPGARLDRLVDALGKAAQHADARALQACQILGELGEPAALVHRESSPALLHPEPGSNPELALVAIEEEGLVAAAGVGLDEEDVLVPLLAFGLEDEDAVGLRVPGEVVEVAARTEAVVGVVGADLLVPGGDHEILAWKALGEGPTPRVEVLRAPDRCDPSLPLRFPVLEHELAEGVRRSGVVAGARRRPLLLLLDFLHGPS